MHNVTEILEHITCSHDIYACAFYVSGRKNGS